MLRALATASLLLLAACGDTSSTAVDAAGPDAAASCEGACRTTALTARFGAVTRTLDHAVYGLTVAAGQPPTAHVEVHGGAAAGCPTEASPTPDYTLVLGAVPLDATGGPASSPGNLLDFVGDLLDGALGARATSVELTSVVSDVCPTCVGSPPPSDPDGFLALDLAATFAGGTVTGHLFAIHCDSLDSRD